MNREYIFQINDDNELVCTMIDSKGTQISYNRKALREFQKLDENDYNSRRINRNSITLTNESISFKIDRYNEFYKNGLMNYLPRNKAIITETIRRYKRNQHKKKKLRQLQKTVNRAIVSAGVLVLLGVGLIKLNAMPKIDDVKLEKPAYASQEEVINSPLYLSDSRPQNIDEILNERENMYLFNSSSLQYSLPPLEQTQELKEEESIEENIAYLDFEHNRDSEKGDHAFDNYYDVVTKVSEKWGISPNMIMCMLTQESGGYTQNLMQIQFWSWEDQVIKLYDFEKDDYTRLVLTNNPNKYREKYGNDIITVNEKELKDPYINILAGGAITRESARMMNNHIGATIQCYNFGCGNMKKVLDETARCENTSVEELLNDQENLDFTKYTRIVKVGDPDYLSHVMQYTNDLEEGFVIKEIDEEGNIIENQIRIIPTSSMSK